MKRLLILILLASAVSFAQQPGAAPASKAKILTRAEFDALLATPGRVLLIDVRRPTEIAQNGGFPVYLNIQAADLEKHLAEIPRGKPIVTVSNHAASELGSRRTCSKAKDSRSRAPKRFYASIASLCGIMIATCSTKL